MKLYSNMISMRRFEASWKAMNPARWGSFFIMDI